MNIENRIEDGGPAFPLTASTGDPRDGVYCQNGMTLRQYAAIHLKVPQSGLPWLDEMIQQARRDKFAGQEKLSDFDHPEEQMPHTGCVALAGPQPDAKDGWEAQFIWNATWRAKLRHLRADAMIEARRVK